jgi:hypothetical protein
MDIFKKSKKKKLEKEVSVKELNKSSSSSTSSNSQSSIKLRVFRINAVKDSHDVPHFDEFSQQEMDCIRGFACCVMWITALASVIL